jgi:hypothetical protein
MMVGIASKEQKQQKGRAIDPNETSPHQTQIINPESSDLDHQTWITGVDG